MPSTEAGLGEELELRETREKLAQLAHRAFGKIPPELLVEQVIAVTEGGDFPLRRGAMEALVRRYGFGQRDGLRVSGRPAGRAVLGLYETRRAGEGGRGKKTKTTRPYRTVLRGIAPLSGSCDCADFQRSGLGLCKHLLCVLDALAGKPRHWQSAREEQERRVASPGARLGWDPVRPLTGPGDWLGRVFVENGADMLRGAHGVEAYLAPTPGEDNRRHLRALFQGQGAKRLELVGRLLTLVERLEKGKGWEWRVDPVLRPLLGHEKDRLEGQRPLAITAAGLRAALRGFKRTIYPYQEEALRRFCESGTLLLADDMGLGKTVQAVAVCHMLKRRGLVRRGLLLVPAALKSQWEREWQASTDLPVTLVDGSPSERAAIYRAHRREGFLIANYEQVLRDLPLMHAFGPDVMVLDEAQRIKNWATKTATFVKQLRPPRRLVLTGTPMENRLEELASVMDWVDDRALEPKWRLVPWHTIFVDGGREAAGARNLTTLRERLAPVMLRRVRQEVLDQLPSRTDTQIPVPMTAGQLSAHQDLSQPIMQIMQRAQRRPLTQAEFLKLMQMLTAQRIICNGLAQLDFEEVWPTLGPEMERTEARLRRLESPKLLELRELVEQLALGQGQKIVLFSQWRRMLSLAHWAVEDLLRRDGVRAVFFSGAESPKRRTQNIVDFHDDPTARLMFCSDAGSVGLNLQRAASCVVILDLPWNPAVLEQRVGRIYRLGQEHPIQVYYLVAETGIEARIARLIGDKQALFSGLFDGQSDEVQFESSGSFLSRVEKLVEAVELPDLPDSAMPDAELALDSDLARDPGRAAEEDLPELGDEVIPHPASGAPALASAPAFGAEARTASAPAFGAEARPAATPDLGAEASPAADELSLPTDDRVQPSLAREDSPVYGGAPGGFGSGPTDTLPPPAQVSALLARVEVRRRADGGLAIEAPPEAAQTLAAVFAGMARLLTEAASVPPPAPPPASPPAPR